MYFTKKQYLLVDISICESTIWVLMILIFNFHVFDCTRSDCILILSLKRNLLTHDESYLIRIVLLLWECLHVVRCINLNLPWTWTILVCGVNYDAIFVIFVLHFSHLLSFFGCYTNLPIFCMVHFHLHFFST